MSKMTKNEEFTLDAATLAFATHSKLTTSGTCALTLAGFYLAVAQFMEAMVAEGIITRGKAR